MDFLCFLSANEYAPGFPAENFAHATHLIHGAMVAKPDVLVLPQTWNTGFFPKENLLQLSDRDGEMVKARIGALTEQHQGSIVAGSVSNIRNGKVFNPQCPCRSGADGIVYGNSDGKDSALVG